jgi:hypothetical protein
MTKARDISGLANGVPNSLINLDSAEIPNLDASKITTGELANARVADLPASKITTGTFADARISQSSVSQHATSFDDNKIINDLSTLALRQATSENAVAYNTNSSFIDVFQDASGIATTTNAQRATAEYISTIFPSPFRYWRFYKTSGAVGGGYHNELEAYENNIKLTLTSSMLSQSSLQNFNAPQLVDNDINTSGFHTDSAGVGAFLRIDLGAGNERVIEKFRFYVTNPQSVTWNIQSSPDNSTWTTRSSSWTTSSVTNAFTERTFTMPVTQHSTGNFIGTTIIAPSSVSSMGAIITYQDQSGTNALNTDIVLELSANNGSNFSVATLSALPNFSTGIKMAKVNDLAVTAGTQLKYRLSFANQSSGSKEARIRGISLQF